MSELNWAISCVFSCLCIELVGGPDENKVILSILSSFACTFETDLVKRHRQASMSAHPPCLWLCKATHWWAQHHH